MVKNLKKKAVAVALTFSGATGGHAVYDQARTREFIAWSESKDGPPQIKYKFKKSKFTFNSMDKDPSLHYEENQTFHAMNYDPNLIGQLLVAVGNIMASCAPKQPVPTPVPQPTPSPVPVPVPTQPPPPSMGAATQDWGASKIQAPEANKINSGHGLKICIVDTGIDGGHPALKDHIKAAQSFTGGNAMDEHFGHGTHVAGIIVNGANDVDLYIAQGLDDKQGSGSLEGLAGGLQWCAQQGVDVISCSWGGGSDSPLLDQTISQIIQSGILINFAAGNDGSYTSYPAQLMQQFPNKLFSITATDQNDRPASFSNYGIAAWASPGVDILSTMPRNGCALCKDNSGYGTMSGTSMATPYASAVLGLAKIGKHAVGVDNIGIPAQYGVGRVNELKTVQQ